MSWFWRTTSDWFGSASMSNGRKFGMSSGAPLAEPISSSLSRSNHIRGPGEPQVVANSRIFVMAGSPLPCGLPTARAQLLVGCLDEAIVVHLVGAGHLRHAVQSRAHRGVALLHLGGHRAVVGHQAQRPIVVHRVGRAGLLVVLGEDVDRFLAEGAEVLAGLR